MDGSAPVSSLRFSCAGCGAPLVLAPSGRELVCERCELRTPIPQAIDAAVPDSPIEDCSSAPPEEVMQGKTGTCSGCGATFSAATLAATCVHCGGALSACPVDLGVPRPHGVLPFTIDEAKANEHAKAELGPSISPLRRTFLPAIVLSVEGHVYYEGVRQDEDGKNVEEIVGQTDYPFDHRMVLGTAEQAAIYCPAGTAWPLGFVEPFSPTWLVGSECEHTNVDAQTAFAKIRNGLAGELVEQAQHEIGGRLDVCKHELGEARYRYVLLPAWMGTYPHKGVEEHFLVHGRTGQVHSAYSQAREDRTASRRRWWVKAGGAATTVIAIGGVLASIVYDAYDGARKHEAKEKAHIESLEALAAADPEVSEVDPIVGTVHHFATESGIRDARVWVNGQPEAVAESDSRGEFELLARTSTAPGAPTWFAIEPSEDYLGTLTAVDASDRSKPVLLEVFAREVLSELQNDLEILNEDQEAIDFEEDKGVVIVVADRTGSQVTITRGTDGAPLSDVFAPDEHSTPRLGQSTIEYAPIPYALFFNVAPATAGQLHVQIEGPEPSCRVDFAEPRVKAKHVTFLHVRCPEP